MKDPEMWVEQDTPGEPGPAFFLFTALTASLLFAILAVTAWRAIEDGKGPAAPAVRIPAQPAPKHLPLTPATTIYVVESKEEAERLQRAFDEWDRSIRDAGLEVELLARVVVAESPEDILQRRVFDFSFLETPDTSQLFRIVDLR